MVIEPVLQVSRPVPLGDVVLFTDGGGPPATIQMPYNQTTCHVRSALTLRLGPYVLASKAINRMPCTQLLESESCI